MKKKLFILDAYALIFRAYYAFIRNPRIDSKGRDTSAIFGFAMMLEDIIEKGSPDYIVVAFDPPGGSFRKELHADYKANREETPETILFSTPYIKELINIYNIPSVVCQNYEADDVIGTIALKAEKEGLEVYMVSADKDFGQIVSENIKLYRPQNGGGYAILGIEEVCEKFGIDKPSQVIDYLALVGDKVDNIPGVQGVGDKTASKLIRQYGSIDGIIDHISEMKGKMKENFEKSVDSIRLSYRLATIDTNAPIDFDIAQYKLEPIDTDALNVFFQNFEIRTLLSRVLQNNIKRFPFENKENKDTDKDSEKNEILTDFKQLKFDVKYLNNKDINSEFVLRSSLAKEMNIAVIPNNADYFNSKIDCIAVSFDNHNVFYIVSIIEDGEKYLETIKSVVENKNIIKVGYDLKALKHLFKNYDISFEGDLFDIMVAHYVLQSDMSHDIKSISQNYLDYTISDREEKKNTENNIFDGFEISQTQIETLVEECYIYSKLKDVFQKQIEDTSLNDWFYNVEMPLVDVLFDMENAGALIDVDELKRQETSFNDKLKQIELDIYRLSGCEFNINSPSQVGEVLFEKLKVVDKVPKTKTGKYKTSEEELVKINDRHPVVSKILEYRTLKKLVSTYLNPIPELLHKDGKLHPKFNQAIASTGRLSSSDPNIQNIPIRTDDGKMIRSAFVPSPGNIFISADYSQIELRLMAEISEDPNLMEAFSNGEDVHQSTASKIFNIPIEFVTPDQRRMAKTANFGIIYGISVFGLKERLNISYGDAKKLIEDYFSTYPLVKKYMDDIVSFAKENGYVSTLTNRRRYINDINTTNNVVRGYAERNAINAPLQGSAADIIKKAMVDIHKEFKSKNIKSKMIIQVHDELDFDVLPSEKDVVVSIIKDKMENVMSSLNVPMVVEVGCGESWLLAH